MVAVARLQTTAATLPAGDEAMAARDVYVARYSNCFKGSSESNVHAERFMLADPGMARALDEVKDAKAHGTRARLVLYLTYQPCHHSGGHSRRGMGEHGTSCTELLCEYVRDVLAPIGVALEVRITYVYRAHWETGAYDPKYAPAVQAARQGLDLLAEAGVGLAACTLADWEWLVSLCEEPVQTAWRNQAHPLDTACREQRSRMDGFIARFLGSLRAKSTATPGEECAVQVCDTEAKGTGKHEEGSVKHGVKADPPAPSADLTELA